MALKSSFGGFVSIAVMKITFVSGEIGDWLIDRQPFFRICGKNGADGANKPSSRIIYAITLIYDGI
jgi:hypothetical protein